MKNIVEDSKFLLRTQTRALRCYTLTSMKKNVNKKHLNSCSTYILLTFILIVTNGRKIKTTMIITNGGKKMKIKYTIYFC
jgi:hypothetical protein